MQCPHCNGQKEVFAFVNTGEDHTKHRSGMIPCLTCSGTGEVDESFTARLEAGRKMRAERVARMESLNEAAKRMGVSSALLSAIEHGRIPRSNAELTGASGDFAAKRPR